MPGNPNVIDKLHVPCSAAGGIPMDVLVATKSTPTMA